MKTKTRSTSDGVSKREHEVEHITHQEQLRESAQGSPEKITLQAQPKGQPLPLADGQGPRLIVEVDVQQQRIEAVPQDVVGGTRVFVVGTEGEGPQEVVSHHARHRHRGLWHQDGAPTQVGDVGGPGRGHRRATVPPSAPAAG